MTDHINRLLLRYCDAVAARDDALFRSVWAEDGVWTVPGIGSTRGVDAIVETLDTLRADMTHLYQLVCGGAAVLSAGGERGRGRWYIQETARLSDGSTSVLVGIYDDGYVLVDDVWRFASRTMSMLHRVRTPAIGRFYDHPGPVDLTAAGSGTGVRPDAVHHNSRRAG